VTKAYSLPSPLFIVYIPFPTFPFHHLSSSSFLLIFPLFYPFLSALLSSSFSYYLLSLEPFFRMGRAFSELLGAKTQFLSSCAEAVSFATTDPPPIRLQNYKISPNFLGYLQD
jgi:hypothetical protein